MDDTLKLVLSRDPRHDNLCGECVHCSTCDFELGDTPWRVVDCSDFVYDRANDLIVRNTNSLT
jgi:hypothetical protein